MAKRILGMGDVVSLIEQARDSFKADHHKLPDSVETLFSSGYLKEIPKDPYGGKFYIDSDGKVKTTSKFANFGAKSSEKAEATGGDKN
jgi:competence protein ComGC